MPRTKRQFSKEFRLEAVKLVIDSGRSCSDVARSHDLAPNLLAGWIRQARVDAGDNPGGKAISSDKDELIRLRKGLRDAEMDNTFLKKSSILRSAKTIKFGAIDRQVAEFTVRWMCQKLSVSRSG